MYVFLSQKPTYVAVHTFNPHTMEAEAGGSHLHNKFQDNQGYIGKHCLNKQTKYKQKIKDKTQRVKETQKPSSHL